MKHAEELYLGPDARGTEAASQRAARAPAGRFFHRLDRNAVACSGSASRDERRRWSTEPRPPRPSGEALAGRAAEGRGALARDPTAPDGETFSRKTRHPL